MLSVPALLLLLAAATTANATVTTHHIGGSFEVPNFTEYAVSFRRALARRGVVAASGGGIRYEAVSLQAWRNAHEWLVYVCDAVQHNNITAFVAVGRQDMINTLAIVTRYVGIPILGYNTAPQTGAPIRVSG